ncbi:MAG: UDP-N-acetylmuramoyl-L-alanyl-D-glutamate--2,6-diaminopimelate ligase [Drouetiella hepatica Uher 2000/2452]|uniref:UDP-N-acetylmuramoyl-L-alanyl-D-glutamate--2,6-diaminopimelate ligase n=1 Tax=Drouetiella hepatica Uher 2000/2452 TaxID=904376 RepID=A0A951QDZ1_9CYAN|nr:UDP-N-acetylmuramoyl-L-alanyl-D-glutamate--2,6-diaminopimelate ligase [Drouetiella hepatica Uher 2000/2452]
MTLRELLATLPDVSLPQHPALDQKVTGLATNSHACQPGDLFIGMPGTRVDGGEFWSGAIAAGAIAALVSPSAAQKVSGAGHQNPCLITSADMPHACAQIATAFYGNPGQKMSMVGVTGTNGKTTTTHLIEFLLNQSQQPTALFGTLYSRWAGHQQTAAHTTPFAPELQAQLSEAVDAGCQYAVMEVSSHALAQGRVWGCPFEVAVFTNLTQDHLDYHKDLDDYFEAKALLFSSDYLKGRAIINRDDAYGRQLIDRLPPDRVWTYSLASLENTVDENTVDLWTSDLVYAAEGVQGILHSPNGSLAFRSPLVGQFNLANLLAAVGAALHLGLDLEAIAQALPQFTGVPGRMEQVQFQPDQDISVIVDYAHTPDSLENMLRAARPFISGRMICVFGCGGDRDRTKRPLMGEIAARLSDWAIVTSDNPRTEDPERILQDIQAGIPASAHITVMGDRAEAIRLAILEAKPGDGVLIAGKGHEDYQILGTEKVHFDDREQAREALMQRFALI